MDLAIHPPPNRRESRQGRATREALAASLGGKGGDGIEYLELVVSSANLTRAAFKGQIQAAWRACIELRPQGSATRLDGWGVLPHFLRELAASAGDTERLTPFVELLARAECPEGVTFVASVPGTHSRQVLRRTPWGVAGLREIADFGSRPGQQLRFSVLSSGRGKPRPSARWCDRFGGLTRSPRVWSGSTGTIRGRATGRWLLPEATLKALTEAGRHPAPTPPRARRREATDFFTKNTDRQTTVGATRRCIRSSGARSRRLLVTSANFSTAAWGRQNEDGKLTIENFELGVCVEQDAWPFDDLEAVRK